MTTSVKARVFRCGCAQVSILFVILSLVKLNTYAKSPFFSSSWSSSASSSNNDNDASSLDKNDASVVATAPQVEDRRPLLLLHVGPHKTATSAMQCYFTHHHELMSRNANASYSGRLYNRCLVRKDGKPEPRFDPRDLVDCLDQHTPETPCPGSETWRYVDEVLASLTDRGRDLVVVSDEAFSRFKRPKESVLLLHQLLSRRFRVRVVVTYRRYHSWVVSAYGRGFPFAFKDDRLPPQYLLRQVVVDGELQFRNYQDFFFDAHPTDWLADTYHEAFSDVVVVDLHNDRLDHVMLKFFADALHHDERSPGLNQTVRAMTRYEPDRPNTGWDNDRINIMTMVRAAARDRLLRKGANKKMVEVAVRRRVDAEGKFPYLDCLSAEEEETFLNKSLTFEKRVLSRWVPRNFAAAELRRREEEHRKEFASAAADHCSVDVDKVNADEEWRRFFRSF